MKKFALAAGILAGILCSCGTDRTQILKVYNWSSYIDETMIPEFEQWYEKQTGEPIHVVYQTFDINETMLAKIEKGHEDFDVVCPSDYIIERMLNSGLLLPLDFAAIPDSINYIRDTKSPYIESIFKSINPNIDANDYSVAYMWGTTGLIYNTKYVSGDEVKDLGAMINPRFKGKILVKDAARDVYSPVLIHLRQEQIAAGQTTIQDLMSDCSDQSIADVEKFLIDARENIYGWEADFGKEQMTQERAWISFNWSGDAVWAIEEAAKAGVELKYVIPEEGSTVWFDGWVIPKYAKNIKAATYFINFMCRPDMAIRNMEETGYIAANGHNSVLESQIDESLEPIDLSYFFGPDAASVRVDPTLYPDKSTIEKCALEHDWGEETAKLLEMWGHVKGSNANAMTAIVAIAVAGACVIAIVIRIISGNKRKKRSSSRKRSGRSK